ncbi:zinc finger protein 37 isoform X2 [Anabrus simplex]
MPKFVCQSCSHRLVSFDHYAEQCLRVQAMFGAILGDGDDNPEKVDLLREEFLQDVIGEKTNSGVMEKKKANNPVAVKTPSLDSPENDEVKKSKSKTSAKKLSKPKMTSGRRLRSTRQKVEGDKEMQLDSSVEQQHHQGDRASLSSVSVKVEIQDNEIFSNSGDKSSGDEENVSVQSTSRKRGRPSKTLVGAAKRKAKVPCVVKRETDESDKDGAASDLGDCDSNGSSSDVEEKDDDPKEKNDDDSNTQPSIFKWECHVCGEVCRNWYCLSIHCRQQHKVPAQVVCVCAKVLASRTSIIKHRLKHTNAYKYRCEKCDKAFHRKALLDLHILSHVPKEEQPFVCCKCARRFHSEALLRQHERVHLPKEERLIYPCTVCSKKFSSKAAVSYHLKAVHSGERPFVCDQCGHSFTSKGILQEHLTIHSDETPFKCAQCRKSFKTKYRLKIHMDTHRETPYQCPVCPLQLSTRRTLRMHLVVHKDTKAYQCATCGKAFRRAKDLKNHHNLHTGRRPYTCTFCPRTFANGSNCRAHKRKMHPEELRIYEAALAAAENEGSKSPVSAAQIAVKMAAAAAASSGINKANLEEQHSNVSAPDLASSSSPPISTENSPALSLQPKATISCLHTSELEASSLPMEKHSIFGTTLDSCSSFVKRTSPQEYHEPSHPDHKYINTSALSGSEHPGQVNEHIQPLSDMGLMSSMSMTRMNNSNTLDNFRSAHNLPPTSETRNTSTINLNVSRRNESLLNSSHMAALTPLNLNVSEMHANRQQHHINESSTVSDMEDSSYMSRRALDGFVNSRHHIPNLNSNIQLHRQQQHQSLTSLSRSLADRDMGVASNLNRMHHAQHSASGSGEPIGGLQNYTSLNHFYQHHSESMPSAVAAAIAHSGSMSVPAFPGNPYIHHNMGYSRGSSDM